MSNEKKFASGLRVSRRDNAPDFVVCQLGFKADEFEAFLRANVTQGGWVNVDVKRSKNGNLYAELNAWKPPQSDAPREPPKPLEDFDDAVPF